MMDGIINGKAGPRPVKVRTNESPKKGQDRGRAASWRPMSLVQWRGSVKICSVIDRATEEAELSKPDPERKQS